MLAVSKKTQIKPPPSPRRETCPYCSKMLMLVYADEKRRKDLVFPEHYVMPQTPEEARVRHLPVCAGSKKVPGVT